MKRAPVVAIVAAMALIAAGASALAAGASTSRAKPAFTDRVFASASAIMHTTSAGAVAVSGADDITSLRGHIFVAFQNGVGPQGEASTTGNKDSSVVEFNLRGHVVKQWDVLGKCDGLTADPATGRVIATVNEDANSSVYLIDPASATPAHYRYNRAVPSNGGTDAISVDKGMVLISGSAPGTKGAAAPNAKYPAVYRVVFVAATQVATLHPLFGDKATATVANTGAGSGRRVGLALTDPDSNEVVPAYAARFARDFMLTSQGDKEQIFASGVGTSNQALSVLRLSDSVDDTAWAASSSGAIYTTTGSTINKVTGPFTRGAEYVADTPCDAGNAPSTCPGPGFPANYLGTVNPKTGKITQISITGTSLQPKGMLFLP